ncbi:hypothetical protein GXW82_43465 [Streptacidiphilus sp. 4-A2]|nr:hypothetical protein [Streptacidiphilus sp. 4-A2]
MPVTAVVSHYRAAKTLGSARLPAPVWPVGSAVVTLPTTPAAAAGTATSPTATAKTAAASGSSAPAPVRAGSLPVWLGTAPTATPRPAGTSARTAPAAPATGRAKVQVLPQSAAKAAGIDGLLLQVTPQQVMGPVQLTLDYQSFADAFGGDWASRLRLVQLPGCALTSPQLASCRIQRPLDTSNDTRAGRLSADLPGTTAATPDGRATGTAVRPAATAPMLLAADASARRGVATSPRPASRPPAPGRRQLGLVHLVLPAVGTQRPRRPVPRPVTGLRLAVGRRADLLDQQPGVHGG